MAVEIPEAPLTETSPQPNPFPRFPFRLSRLLEDVGPFRPPYLGKSSNPNFMPFLGRWRETHTTRAKINERAIEWAQEVERRKAADEPIPDGVHTAVARQFWSTYVQVLEDFRRDRRKPFTPKPEEIAPIPQEDIQLTNYIIWHGPLQTPPPLP